MVGIFRLGNLVFSSGFIVKAGDVYTFISGAALRHPSQLPCCWPGQPGLTRLHAFLPTKPFCNHWAWRLNCFHEASSGIPGGISQGPMSSLFFWDHWGACVNGRLVTGRISLRRKLLEAYFQYGREVWACWGQSLAGHITGCCLSDLA